MQKRLYGKEQNFRGSKNPYDLTNREFEVIVRNTDSNLTYWILVDIFYSHYIKNGAIYIADDFIKFLLSIIWRWYYNFLIFMFLNHTGSP